MIKRVAGMSAVMFVLIVSGCSRQHEQQAFVSQSLQELVVPRAAAKASPVGRQRPSPSATYPQLSHSAHPSTTPPIGIVIDKNRIVIDANQTRHFFESLTHKLDQNFKQIEQGLRKEKLRSPNDTGIVITEDRLEIDLNKTQNFVEKWMRSLETVGQQLDGIVKELDKSFNP